jgi:hypothetical protein
MPLHPVLADLLHIALAAAQPLPRTRRDARLPRVPGKVHSVIGVRRAGKTTFLHQLRDEVRAALPPERALYVGFDDDRLAGIRAEQLGFLLEEYYRTYPALRGRETVHWYLDEIQLVPGWERFCRRVLDTEKVELVVSGSSARMLSREVHTSLRGRGMATVTPSASASSCAIVVRSPPRATGVRRRSTAPSWRSAWQAIRLSGSDALAARASKRLRSDELLVTSLGPTILRKHLDDVPLWRGDHVAVRLLVEDFARYLYLPRLAGPEVLVHAIRDGVALLTWQSDTFAYAERHDEGAARYPGLRGGQVVTLSADSPGVLVKPDVARRQLDAEAPPAPAAAGGEAGPGAGSPTSPPGASSPEEAGATGGAPRPARPRRFHGTVALDPARVGRDASRIADEVIAHLAGQVGADVRVTLEIEAALPNGASDQVVRTVTENSRTLKFTGHGFEAE